MADCTRIAVVGDTAYQCRSHEDDVHHFAVHWPACPAPWCRLKPGHRTLHDIPSGKPEFKDAPPAGTPVPRIRVRMARDVPGHAVRVFGAVLWRNQYGYRSRNGLARVPAAESDAPWEYEGRISAAGYEHAFHHADGRTTAHTVRYMTRRECQETFRRVLTGEGTGELRGHRPLASIPEIVESLKGRALACTCPFPRDGGKDWCHAADLAWLAATHEVARLDCLSEESARLVVAEADRPGTHRAVRIGGKVFVSYSDKRYPLDVATWAAENECASDEAAGSLIGRL
jgi:hypothetical protein